MLFLLAISNSVFPTTESHVRLSSFVSSFISDGQGLEIFSCALDLDMAVVSSRKLYRAIYVDLNVSLLFRRYTFWNVKCEKVKAGLHRCWTLADFCNFEWRRFTLPWRRPTTINDWMLRCVQLKSWRHQITAFLHLEGDRRTFSQTPQRLLNIL